jgi:hypothetical protein
MAEIRYVTIPSDRAVTIEALDGPRESKFSFWEFLKGRTKDAAFGRDLDGVLTAMAIRQHFAAGVAGVGEVVGLTLEQWEPLCEAVRKPSDGYNPEVMAQLMPFARAILDAPSTDPRPQAAEAGA